MASTKQNLDAATSFFDEITPQRDTGPKPESAKESYKKPSLEKLTGRPTVHYNALLYADDLEAVKDLAWKRRKKTSEVFREIISEYVRTHHE